MANENAPYNISGGVHYWTQPNTTVSTSTSSVTAQDIIMELETPTIIALDAHIARVEEVLKGKAGGSAGGKDPRARKDPLRRLVRTYGKWANGRFSKCRTVLSKHPKLVAAGGGNVNALCAWMKDQWAGTTKWRGHGPKEKAEDKAIQAAARARHAKEADSEDNEYKIIPLEWMDDEFVNSLADYFEALLADEEENGIVEGLERDVPAPNLDSIEDPGEEYEYVNDVNFHTQEMDISHNEVHQGLNKGLRELYKKEKKEESPSPSYDPYWYVKDVYDDYFIYCYDEKEYRLDYSVDDKGEVTVDPLEKAVEVMQQWIPVASSSKEAEAEGEEEPKTEDSPANEPEAKVEAKPTPPETPKSTVWTTIRGTKGDFVVLVDKKNMSIVRGPKSLVGKRLPKMPKELAGQLKEEGDMGDNEGKALPWKDCIKKTMKSGKTMPEAIKICGAIRTKSMKAHGGKTLTQMSKEEDAQKTNEAKAEAETEAQAVLVGESASVDVDVFEIFSEDNVDVMFAEETSEAGGDPSTLKTPSGVEVDAIIRIISPGPGNRRDNFYYPAEVIKRDIKVIAEGKKMYKDHLTEKQEKELQGRPRSVNDWAAVIEEAWADPVTGEGFGGIKFVDSAFQEKVKKGFKHLGVSIRSQAKAKLGTIGGKPYRVIENFISGRSVDFVTEAGARGGFIAVAESNSEEDLNAMDLNDLTLDELQEKRPDLLTMYLEAVEAEKEIEEEETSEGETQTQTVSLSLEDVQKLIATAKAEAKDEAVKEADARIQKAEELSMQRSRLTEMLNKSGLKAASQNILRNELHDVHFPAQVNEAGEEKTSLELFEAHAQEMIDSKVKEISEYTRPVTRVSGLGPSKKSDSTETKEGEATPEPITRRTDRHIDSLLGISETSKS